MGSGVPAVVGGTVYLDPYLRILHGNGHRNRELFSNTLHRNVCMSATIAQQLRAGFCWLNTHRVLVAILLPLILLSGPAGTVAVAWLCISMSPGFAPAGNFPGAGERWGVMEIRQTGAHVFVFAKAQMALWELPSPPGTIQPTRSNPIPAWVRVPSREPSFLQSASIRCGFPLHCFEGYVSCEQPGSPSWVPMPGRVTSPASGLSLVHAIRVNQDSGDLVPGTLPTGILLIPFIVNSLVLMSFFGLAVIAGWRVMVLLLTLGSTDRASVGTHFCGLHMFLVKRAGMSYHPRDPGS
jgi:hypothetical protein